MKRHVELIPGDPRGHEPYAAFKRTTWSGLLRHIKTQGFVTPNELADALEANPGAAIPDELRLYFLQALRGELKSRRGRPPADAATQLRDHLIRTKYAMYLAWLQGRNRRLGLEGPPCLDEVEWWQGPPAERAARMTVRFLRRGRFPAVSWEHVRNLASSGK